MRKLEYKDGSIAFADDSIEIELGGKKPTKIKKPSKKDLEDLKKRGVTKPKKNRNEKPKGYTKILSKT